MEEPLLRSAKKKREILRSSLTTDVVERKWSTLDRRGTTLDSAERNTKFYEDGVWELLKARTCLCGSYAYGFFMEEELNCDDAMMSQRKRVFEIMQNELEEITERLSEMIARPYLRTPRRVIVQTLQLCRRKRQVRHREKQTQQNYRMTERLKCN
jgi:ankyrin repeat/IBR domain-containing protein 1